MILTPCFFHPTARAKRGISTTSDNFTAQAPRPSDEPHASYGGGGGSSDDYTGGGKGGGMGGGMGGGPPDDLSQKIASVNYTAVLSLGTLTPFAHPTLHDNTVCALSLTTHTHLYVPFPCLSICVQDPGLQRDMQDPEVRRALMDIQANPATVATYMASEYLYKHDIACVHVVEYLTLSARTPFFSCPCSYLWCLGMVLSQDRLVL